MPGRTQNRQASPARRSPRSLACRQPCEKTPKEDELKNCFCNADILREGDHPYACDFRFAEAVCPESYFPYFRKRRQGKLLVCVSGVVECGSLSSLLSSLGARLAFGLWPAAAATHRRPNQMADIKRGDGRERGGTGGGNDSFMAAEKEEREREREREMENGRKRNRSERAE